MGTRAASSGNHLEQKNSVITRIPPRRSRGQKGNKMKVKELIAKMNCSSTLPVRMKTDINDPGVLLAWKRQTVIFGGNCTVSGFEVNKDEMVIYYRPEK